MGGAGDGAAIWKLQTPEPPGALGGTLGGGGGRGTPATGTCLCPLLWPLRGAYAFPHSPSIEGLNSDRNFPLKKYTPAWRMYASPKIGKTFSRLLWKNWKIHIELFSVSSPYCVKRLNNRNTVNRIGIRLLNGRFLQGQIFNIHLINFNNYI